MVLRVASGANEYGVREYKRRWTTWTKRQSCEHVLIAPKCHTKGKVHLDCQQGKSGVHETGAKGIGNDGYHSGFIGARLKSILVYRHISGGQRSIQPGWTLARTRKLKCDLNRNRSKSAFIEQEIRAVGIGAVGGDSISSTDPYRVQTSSCWDIE
ncbi:hypothetical protein R1flu_011598 [Riccia fluitans]|uniref:Uncharacterized protein n=1 Tax=Riccia fluitans TaxID=41844 RepID=A0ABD1Z8M6_9MARC